MRLSGADDLMQRHGSQYARDMLEGVDCRDDDEDPLLAKAEVEIDKDMARTLTDRMMEGSIAAHWNPDDFQMKLKRLLLAYARHNRSFAFDVFGFLWAHAWHASEMFCVHGIVHSSNQGSILCNICANKCNIQL